MLALAGDVELSAAALSLVAEPLLATDATADEAAPELEADAANVALDEELDVTSPAEDVACVPSLAVVAAEVALGRAESIPPAAVASPPNPEYVCR